MKRKIIIQSGVALLLCFICAAAYADAALSIGPYLRFITPESAVISWRTDQSVKAKVEITTGDKVFDVIQVNSSSTKQSVTVKNMAPKTPYCYQITLQPGDADIKSPTYEIDWKMNYTKYPLPDGASLFDNASDYARYAKMAQQILSDSGVTKGYCVVYGCSDGRLAYELARQSELTILGFDENKNRIQAIRNKLLKSNLYGSRFTFYNVQSLNELPLPDSFANLIVSERLLDDGVAPGSAQELSRVLRPSGGVAWLGQLKQESLSFDKNKLTEWLSDIPYSFKWKNSDESDWVTFERKSLDGIGSWTHQYGNNSNTSNSGDSLLGVSSTDDMGVQWIGRPGADFGIDRNPRMPAPLAVNGRLFHQGMNRLAALDAYNGSILWSLEIPDLRRVNIPRDASNWCADDDFIYAAIEEECWQLNAGNGDLEQVFVLPSTVDKETDEWGYIASEDELIFGSTIKKGSVYTEFFGNKTWYDQTSGFGTGKICSDRLFACQKDNGATVWQYEDGVIINTTISMGDGKIFFVESRYPSVNNLTTSRVESAGLWRDQYMVALDAKTGNKLWEKPLDTHNGIVVFFMLYSDDSLVITSSGNNKYHLYSYDAQNGNENWNNSHPWPNNNHGGHMQHPAVTNHTVYVEPCGYNMKTGELVTKDMGRHSGCATYAATSDALIYRGDSRRISMWDFETGKVSSWYNLRPSCWLSVIPAGGMILAPEGGGGCSCGNWLETSVGFMPVKENIQ